MVFLKGKKGGTQVREVRCIRSYGRRLRCSKNENEDQTKGGFVERGGARLTCVSANCCRTLLSDFDGRWWGLA